MFITLLELKIALTFLKIKKFRGIVSIFSFIGIFLGVATLIIVTSVMNGFREELLGHIIGVNGHINISNKNYTYKELKNILHKVNAIPGIEVIIPTIEEQTVIISKTSQHMAIIRGIKQEDLPKETQILSKIIEGSAENFDDGMIIGSQIAADLNVGVGDYVKFISPEFNNTFIGKIPRMKSYKIIAIFSVGMMEYDSTLIYMPFDFASKFFKSEDIPNKIDVYIGDINKANIIAQKIIKLTGLAAVDWQTQQSVYFNALKVEKNVMFTILMMIILIAVFNIISSLFMLIDEKKQSIAILRTLGMTRISIVKIFILCGTLIGAVGTIFGVMLGVLFAKNINNIKNILESITSTKIFDPIVYYFSNIPIQINILEVAIISTVTILLAFLGTIPAAVHAAKQEPAKVLRGV